jgi:hypothetical protein
LARPDWRWCRVAGRRHVQEVRLGMCSSSLRRRKPSDWRCDLTMRRRNRASLGWRVECVLWWCGPSVSWRRRGARLEQHMIGTDGHRVSKPQCRLIGGVERAGVAVATRSTVAAAQERGCGTKMCLPPLARRLCGKLNMYPLKPSIYRFWRRRRGLPKKHPSRHFSAKTRQSTVILWIHAFYEHH